MFAVVAEFNCMPEEDTVLAPLSAIMAAGVDNTAGEKKADVAAVVVDTLEAGAEDTCAVPKPTAPADLGD